MIGNLSTDQIERLLHQQVVGRLACHYHDDVYIVPVSYAYDNNCIYCHAFEGKKMKMMRKNPRVCFQVDEMKDMSNWKSVIAWGKFEELNERDEKNKALSLLLERQLPMVSSTTTHLGESWPFSGSDIHELNIIPGIVFRISLTEKTGRFEQTSDSPSLMFG
jgi:nitroimidazol reductase NimA-like FMN-containing flavoprotein (pyridoxamine 5'-phosphate oxidase superfamily)